MSVLVNIWVVPNVCGIAALLVSLGSCILPLNQLTFAKTLLFTSSPTAMLQLTDTLVPAYRVVLGIVRVMLGLETEMKTCNKHGTCVTSYI